MHRPRNLLAAVVAASAVVLGLVGPGAPDALAAAGPNGLIAYSSWNDQLEYDIYVVDPAQPNLQPIQLTTDGAYNSDPDWSPDGTKIVFDGWGEFGGPRIQVMDVDPVTDDQTLLTQPTGGYGDFQPAWSPNGTRIAFVSSRTDGVSEEWGYEIYVMDAIGEVGPLVAATRLTTDSPDPDTGRSIEDSQVTWSPDGSRLAFVSTGRGLDPDACDLWVMDSADTDGDGFGDNLDQLTFDESFNCDAFEDITPQWSPNSSLIAFTSVRTGNFDIWLVNANDATDLRNVTATVDQNEDQPAWSPDGTQIVFRSGVSGQYELYSLPVPPRAGASAAAQPSEVTTVAARPTQLTSDGLAKQQADWGARRGAVRGTATLSVAKVGLGRVSANKIDCGKDCASTFVLGRSVTLSATPAPGYRFKRWTGACSGTQRTCTVRMGTAKTVMAAFVRR
ncbi:MAG: TolB protein [Chloroflexota bacterium]|nr:TolB protein [Chloroflexota bacterium]